MHTETAQPPGMTAFERTYLGTVDQVGMVRADLTPFTEGFPSASDLVLLASELGANATTHSRSGEPGGKFTVRAILYPGDHAWVEVIDQGGDWTSPKPDDEHGRGLGIVAAIAGDGNWGIDGDTTRRVVWFRLEWPGQS
jgi:hypothetical protein